MRRYRIFPFIFGAAILVALLMVLHFLFPGTLYQEESQIRLVSLIIVGSYLLLGLASKNWKGPEVMRGVIGWSSVAIVLLFGYSFRDDLQSIWFKIQGELIPTHAKTINEKTVEITKTNNNHFEVIASINNKNIHFLIDTGATNVTLTKKDAQRIGINTKDLKYNIQTNTANGKNWSASIILDYIKIGDIEVKDIRAHVSKSGLDISLLGMSFLSRLKSYSVQRQKMILKNY